MKLPRRFISQVQVALAEPVGTSRIFPWPRRCRIPRPDPEEAHRKRQIAKKGWLMPLPAALLHLL